MRKKHNKKYVPLYVLLFSFTLFSSLYSQIVWTKHIIENHSTGLTSSACGDVDGDGDIDIVQEYVPNYELSWFENDGFQNFTKHVIDISYFLGGRKPFLIDFDKDGDMDIIRHAYWNLIYKYAEIAWYENDGNQNFVKHMITKDTMAYCFYPVDLDQDGDNDIIIPFYDYFDGVWVIKLTWFENDGSQNFTQHIIESGVLNGLISSVYADDIDLDGDIDLVCAYKYLDCIAWFENDGNQNFTKYIIDSFESYPNWIYSLDIDRDGDIDIFASWRGQSGNPLKAWHENDGNQNFTTHPIPMYVGDDYAFADFDADGDWDFGFVIFQSNKVIWSENDGTQNYTEHVIDDDMFEGVSISVADIDNDGDIDINVSGYYQTVWYENSNIGITEKKIKLPRYTSFLRIKDLNFRLYDVTGKMKGIYKEDKLNYKVPKGIYFLKCNQPKKYFLKIINLR